MPEARGESSETIALPLAVLKVLRFLQTRAWAEVAVLQISPVTSHQVESVLTRYIVYHLERTLRSATFLERLRDNWRVGRVGG